MVKNILQNMYLAPAEALAAALAAAIALAAAELTYVELA
jgi:hypothetical protein